MYGFVTRAVFGLEVVELNSKVRISGIHVGLLIDDINKNFGTTRVTVNMLSKATRTYIEFHSFFLIDVEYIIRKLMNLENTRLGKRGYIKMHEALLTKTWLNRLTQAYPSMFNKAKLKEIKFDLLKHQSEFIDYYDRVLPRYNLKGMLLAATPGSGKTISAIAVACSFESQNVIIISPKNAVFRVWEKTLLEDMTVPQSVWVSASKTPIPPPDKNRWYIFHYESLGEAIELSKRLINTKCTVVLDESHNLNEMKSLRTERFVQMCRSMNNAIVVELSGTPMKAMGSEAIPLISAIDPLFNDRCVEKFKKIYGREAKAATEILANRLGIIMYKVNKEESKINEVVEHTVNVKIKDAHRFTLEAIKVNMTEFVTQRTKYYNDNKARYTNMYYSALREFESIGLTTVLLKTDYETYTVYVNQFKKYGYDPMSSAEKAMFCNHFEKKVIEPRLSSITRRQFRDSKTVVKYVNLKIRGECLGTVLGRSRTECNKAILESLELAELIDGAAKKTLIFTSYVDVVKQAAEKLTQQGYSPLTVYADTNHNLPAMVTQFTEDETVNPLIATYQSLSTAVPLIMANRVILLNAPFRIHEKEQTVARANRLGQDHTVDVYNVYLDTGGAPNISTRSADIMEWSREQVDAIMGFDNMDNAVTLEEYCIDEITLESFNLDTENNMDTSTSTNTVDAAPQLPCTPVETTHTFSTSLNDLSTNQKVIDVINDNIKKGVTLTPMAHELYRVIDPEISAVAIEAHHTTYHKTMLSLEHAQNRRKSLLTRLIEIFARLFKRFMGLFKSTNNSFVSNANRSYDVRRHINAGVSGSFKGKNNVEVNALHWLTRGDKVTAENHVRDILWQLDVVTKFSVLVKADLKHMAKYYCDRLDDLRTEPKLNQMESIVKRTLSLTKALPEPKVKDYEGFRVLTSAPMLGGKVTTLSVPTNNDGNGYLKNYDKLKISFNVRDNLASKSQESAPPLNRAQALRSLESVEAMSKQMSYLNTYVQDTASNYDGFIAKVNQFLSSPQVESEAHYKVLVAQTTFMVNGLYVLVRDIENLMTVVDRASKAAISYTYISARND